MHQTETFTTTVRKRPVRKQDSVDCSLDVDRKLDRKLDRKVDRKLDGLPRRNGLDGEPVVVDPKSNRQANSAEGNQGSQRKRVETVVETLAALRGHGETLAEVAHDARNMVTALGLYCDLLEEPGVLATPFIHYGHELRLVAVASRRLVEKIVAIDAQRERTNTAGGLCRPASPAAHCAGPASEWLSESRCCTAQGDQECAESAISGRDILVSHSVREPSTRADSSIGRPSFDNLSRRWDLLPALPVANLAAELLANRNLLAALAGPAIALTVHAEGGARPVHLTGEDLTRVLVNLVKNATEAMPSGGRIHIGLHEEPPAKGTAACLLLTVEDNGPGIANDVLETIFTSGYTSQGTSNGSNGDWTLSHRGLGLTISRSIVEGAGGRIAAENREQGGARFALELPLRPTSH
ncbi:MAG TPA: ATP-binding protein [Terracidiphilus sp.]|jgi:signal transduction histidine kinase